MLIHLVDDQDCPKTGRHRVLEAVEVRKSDTAGQQAITAVLKLYLSTKKQILMQFYDNVCMKVSSWPSKMKLHKSLTL